MGRLKKKGKAGEAAAFISRSRAVRKLQLGLADFRRICILKGIYPREPKNRKRVTGGSTQASTYYFVKDINFLAHEPLIEKFREHKVFLRKLKKALAKSQPEVAGKLKDSAPVLTLHHIVKERYPTFVDALRDLDDALCLVFMFASLPSTKHIDGNKVHRCQQLAAELKHYLIATRSLRKVFVSIKGIYYQAEIAGQSVTWLTPFQFSTEIPTDVDFRVMGTFLLFYTTLLSFVNFELYSQLGYHYPPKVDAKRDADACGLQSLVLESKTSDLEVPMAAEDEGVTDKETENLKRQSEKRVSSVKDAIGAIEADSGEQDDAEQVRAKANGTDGMDAFPEQIAGGDEPIPTSAQESREGVEEFAHMFDGLCFFLSREVPIYSLEFVIRAFGGRVSWAALSDSAQPGSFAMADECVTHCIVDRPKLAGTSIGKAYVQPQWVYDCVNARKVLSTGDYAIGARLPPHLSPFIDESADDYIPPERAGQLATPEEEAALDALANGEAMEEEEEEELGDEELYRKELEAEAQGKEYKPPAAANGKKTKAGSKKADKAKKAKQAAEDEEKNLATMMMTKKNRKLYNQIMYTKDKKKKEADRLQAKRKQLDAAKGGDKRAKKKKRT